MADLALAPIVAWFEARRARLERAGAVLGVELPEQLAASKGVAVTLLTPARVATLLVFDCGQYTALLTDRVTNESLLNERGPVDAAGLDARLAAFVRQALDAPPPLPS